MDEPTRPEVVGEIADETVAPRGLSRRSVLVTIGAGVVAWRIPRPVERFATRPVRALLERNDPAPGALVDPFVAGPSLITTVVRAQDFLSLTFFFYNLQLRTTGPDAGNLVRISPTRTAYVVVWFPPQHVAEQTFATAPPPPPVRAQLAGASRLAFTVPKKRTSIPYTLEALLDWGVGKLIPSLVPAADGPGGPLAAPAPTQTAIEVPFDLVLSPGAAGGWAHSTVPVADGDRVELWHTRLGTAYQGHQPIEPPELPASVRAVWPATDLDVTPDPYALPVSARQRVEIVANTANWTTPNYTPVAVAVNQLMLSALGASTDLAGDWLDAEVIKVDSDLIQWRQRSSLGRDNYVKVVEVGFLFPFGHQAIRTKITVRQFVADAKSGDVTAFLSTTTYIQVREPFKAFPAFAQPNAGRDFPFTSARIDTVVTPPLLIDETKAKQWVTVLASGEPLQWKITLTDLDGHAVKVVMPLEFVMQTNGYSLLQCTGLCDDYVKPANDVYRPTLDLAGQKVAYAPASKPGAATFPTSALRFKARVVQVADRNALIAHRQPYFYPQVDTAVVRMPAVEQITGAAAQNGPLRPAIAPAGIPIKFNDKYVQNLANFGATFADVITPPPPISIPPALSGGIASTQQAVKAISSELGPVSGVVSELQGGTFDPKQFFPYAPKLFGTLPLTDILPTLTGLSSTDHLAKIPGITSNLVYPNGDKTRPPDAIHTHLHWVPSLQNSPGNLFIATLDGSPASLRLDVDTVTPLASPDKPTIDLDADLQSFTLSLFGTAAATHFIDLKFHRMRFRSKTGSKPSVDVDLAEVVFTGPLSFVKTLSDYLGSLGGPDIDVNAKGITAGYSLAIPTLSVGVVSLQNISFGGHVFLPLQDGEMNVGFNFCTREHPFVVTVALFGGGGFFNVALGAGGLELLEASIEFGGNFAFDIGVASGGVHVMAGIYFRLTQSQVALTGYLRLGGELEVLGLISISLEFVLSFTYKSTGKAYGRATLTVKIDIAFFSTSVDLEVEKQFAGAEGDPSFKDLMAPSDWDAYSDAFAA